MPNTATATPCSCDFANAVDHDRMLGLLDDPAVLRDVIKNVAGWEQNDLSRLQKVGLYDLEKFVAQHNWSDPVAAYWLAIHIQDLLEAVRKTDEANTIGSLEALPA